MRKRFVPKFVIGSKTYNLFIAPLRPILPHTPKLESRGDRPLKMKFEDQLNALIYYHLQEHSSARHLIQDLKEDEFAKKFIAPEGGISRSSFSEAINNRGLEQLQHVFQELYKQASDVLPSEYEELGELISIDGSLIDAVLSMHWADYRKGTKKAKAHMGFNINKGIPKKVFLTDGNAGERPFVDQILSPGQTGVMDRGYQSHRVFDLLQSSGKSFVCRIKAKTAKKVIQENPIDESDYIFYDAEVLLGSKGINQTERSVRVVGYKVDGTKFYVATDRRDLSADQVATIYKLRWKIESFFKWWKQHIKVYHLIAHSKYGLMVQILGGLITYLLMSIYCHKQYNEKVSIKRVRQLRSTILNELYGSQDVEHGDLFVKEQPTDPLAKT